MCGRFTQMLSWRELVALYRLTDKFLIRNTEARYNIAPTQMVPVVRQDPSGSRYLTTMRWVWCPTGQKTRQSAAR